MLIAVLALPAPAAMCIFAAKARDGLRLYGRRRPLRAGGFGSYNLKTHIKVGSSNWGRGIGWYVLAATYLPEFTDEKIDNNLLLISKTQFPQTSRQFDSSTALLFELYTQDRGFNTRSIDFIKPYILQSGFVTECSGDTYDFNNHSYIFGSAEMTNGFFLMLASKL